MLIISAGPPRGWLRALRRPAWGALKGRALFLLPLLLQGMILAFLIWKEPSRREAEQRALQAHRAIARIESAARALIQERDRLSSFVLSGSLRRGGRSLRTAVAELERLRREVSGDSRRFELAGDLLANARAMEAWSAGVEALVKAGRTDEAARLIGTEGERLQQELLTKLERFEALEQRSAQEGSSRLASIRRLSRALLAGAGLGTVATSVLVAWLFFQQISSRLAVVAANARRIAENAPLAPPLSGGDDISRLDLTLRQTAHRLTETIRQRDAALEESAEELAAANRELRLKAEDLEAFIRGVSHDLRSPLVNIKGFSREIELSCGDLQRLLGTITVEPEARSRLDAIDREIRESVYYLGTGVASADRIIGALQKLARAGHRHYEWRVLNVHEIVARVVDAMHGMITEKKATVIVNSLPVAWGDANAVEQIFANLLKNAVAYLDPDRPGRIEIGAQTSRPGAPVTYWVRDNGVGIPAERQTKIFSAFERIRSDLAEGEGIGLALVHRSVNRLGGQIRVESREGAGSTFFVTLRTDFDRKVTPLPFPAQSRLTR